MGYGACADQIGQVEHIEIALHAHINARQKRHARRIAAIARDAVLDQFFIARVIRYDHPAEMPLIAQQIAHQPVVGGRGYARNLVERGHRRAATRVKRRFERRQIDLAQGAFGDVGGAVIEAVFGGAISGEMFGAGHDRIIGGKVVALKTAHAGGGEQPAQEHIFARPFHRAAPALIARDVDHWREGPVNPRARRLISGNARGAGGQFGLEAGDFADRRREDGAVAVNDVGGEDQRDLEARAGHDRALQALRHHGAIAVEYAG